MRVTSVASVTAFMARNLAVVGEHPRDGEAEKEGAPCLRIRLRGHGDYITRMRSPVSFLLFLGLSVAAASALHAQVGRPAARLEPLVETDAARVGAPVRLALRVVLPGGLHVQSSAPRDPAFIPTRLTVQPPPGVTIDEIIYPTASELKQDGLAAPLDVFGHEFVIGVRATLAASVTPGELSIPAQLRYQACNDKVCFPPVTTDVTWRLRAVSPFAGVTPLNRDVFGQFSPSSTAAEPPASPTPRTLVAMVRSAMAQDYPRAEALVTAYQAEHGISPELLLAKSWLGRGALYAGALDAAERHAQETYDLGLEELQRRPMDQEPNFPTAFGAAIEVLGQAAAARGRRTDAVAFFTEQLERYGDTSLHKRIQKNINLVSLEGSPAPTLDLSDHQGVPPPPLEALKGRVVLLFFWAHWCSDCKAQGPVLERLLAKYGPQGFTIVAPTQRFGYVAGGESAPADVETRYIAQIRETQYGWLAQVPVTLNETSLKRYGVSSTPTIVLIDRGGIVRLYHPGQVPEARLEALVRELVEK